MLALICPLHPIHRHRKKDWSSALPLPPQSSNMGSWALSHTCHSPDTKLQTSRDSSHTEVSSLESYCWPSFVLDTLFTGTQRLGLRTCLATSKFKHRLCVSPDNSLQHSSKRISRHLTHRKCKPDAGLHLSLTPHSQTHKDSSSALALPPQSPNIGSGTLQD